MDQYNNKKTEFNDDESIGTDSILSLYEYGAMSSDDFECNSESDNTCNYDTDKDPEYTPNQVYSKLNEDSDIDNPVSKEDLPTSINNNIGYLVDAINIENNIGYDNIILTDTCSTGSNKKRRISPKEKTRKRTRNVENWLDVKSKAKLNYGVEHLNRKGQIICAKKMGLPCPITCRLKCHENINYEERYNLFQLYWNLENRSRKWDFLARYVKVSGTKQAIVLKEFSRRKFSRKYFLIVKNKEIQVCKKMFLNTFGISEKVVNTICKKLEDSPTINADMTGKHKNRQHTIPCEVKQFIREHINSFPVVDSHYTRNKTDKKYLEANLTISKMHRLYLEWVNEKPVETLTKNATLRQYTDVFNEFNISFFKPKKDLCDVCEKYKIAEPKEKEEQQIQYDEHLFNKEVVRRIKNADKEKASIEPGFCVAVFDLEKVLTTPQGETSTFYYKRKFATYNFTIYDIGKKEGFCYIWNESDAKRGANEIATCLFMFLKQKKDDGIQEFSFYSDNCGGQNRNRFVFAMWEYAAYKLKIKITHRFLEKGHTQNEGDSMHATIEKTKKGKTIYVPAQWVTLVQCAKVKGAPYSVKEVSNKDFLDFKHIVNNSEYNWKLASNGLLVKWSCVKEIMVTFKCPFQLSIKYNLNITDDTITISLQNKKNRGRHQPHCGPVRAYDKPFPIEKLKLNDLLSLCNTGLIPTVYHAFYKSLSSSPASE